MVLTMEKKFHNHSTIYHIKAFTQLQKNPNNSKTYKDKISIQRKVNLCLDVKGVVVENL